MNLAICIFLHVVKLSLGATRLQETTQLESVTESATQQSSSNMGSQVM